MRTGGGGQQFPEDWDLGLRGLGSEGLRILKNGLAGVEGEGLGGWVGGEGVGGILR